VGGEGTPGRGRKVLVKTPYDYTFSTDVTKRTALLSRFSVRAVTDPLSYLAEQPGGG
jgi:hypothetical protein